MAEIGIGVAEAGATGATGAFPRDRGPWRSGESYEWSADYRDKVIHPFNGVYYNFLVRTQARRLRMRRHQLTAMITGKQ